MAPNLQYAHGRGHHMSGYAPKLSRACFLQVGITFGHLLQPKRAALPCYARELPLLAAVGSLKPSHIAKSWPTTIGGIILTNGDHSLKHLAD